MKAALPKNLTRYERNKRRKLMALRIAERNYRFKRENVDQFLRGNKCYGRSTEPSLPVIHMPVVSW